MGQLSARSWSPSSVGMASSRMCSGSVPYGLVARGLSSRPLRRADRSRAAGFLQVRPRTGTGGQRDVEDRDRRQQALKTRLRRLLSRDLGGFTPSLLHWPHRPRLVQCRRGPQDEIPRRRPESPWAHHLSSGLSSWWPMPCRLLPHTHAAS